MARRLIPVAVVVLMATLSACDTETSLEVTPEAIPGCNALQPPDDASGDWGEAEGVPNQGVRVITVNEGYTVDICAGGGNQRFDGSFSSPGMLEVGSNFNGWSVVSFTEPPTTVPDPTTTEAGGPTSTEAGGATTTSTVEEMTTTSEIGGGTLDPGQETTTTGGGATTVPDVGGGDITSTTADEGVVDPGQVTTTTGQGGAGDGSGEETSTTGDEVAGESTLPYTGNGDISATGLAVVLLVSGAVILLIARRRPDSE